MKNWYNWNFPAKFLPKWVKEERSRTSKAIIRQDEIVKELRNCLIFSKEMMTTNDLILPKTFEKIDSVLDKTGKGKNLL